MATDTELCTIQEMLRVDTQGVVSPLRDRWVVDLDRAPDLTVQGNIRDQEHTIERGANRVAEVSRRWSRARDTYGVKIAAGGNDALILALPAMTDIDTVAEPGR